VDKYGSVGHANVAAASDPCPAFHIFETIVEFHTAAPVWRAPESRQPHDGTFPVSSTMCMVIADGKLAGGHPALALQIRGTPKISL
jgi:hypothetical protein